MTNRINYIDRMKGLAILVVVLAHVYLLSFEMGDSLVSKFCMSFEMPLFMFVSGFVAYLSPQIRGGNRTLSRRLLSYVCPAFALSYALALYSFLILGNREIDVVETLTGGLWYLKALAIFVCLQMVLMRCKHVWLELLFVAVIEFVFLIGWKTSPFLHRLFCLEHCFFFYPFFMLGYYARRYNLVEYVKSRNWVYTLALIGFVCLLNAQIEVHAFRFLSERIVRPICAILVITYLFAIREKEENLFEKWLNRIGTKTLDIYMYHGLLIYGMYSCFDFRFVKQNEMLMSNPVLCLMIALLVTLFLSYVSIAIGLLVRKSTILEYVVYGKFVKRKA